MAILVRTDFVRKATVRVICYVYDDDEALVDATSVSVSIIPPNGTAVVDDQAMTKTATGIYEYFYTTTASVAEGDYQVECDILDGSYHTFAHGHFKMAAGINE